MCPATPGTTFRRCQLLAKQLGVAPITVVVADATEQAYRRGSAIDKRRELMQAWADYCTQRQS
jgi:hypothetical protein